MTPGGESPGGEGSSGGTEGTPGAGQAGPGREDVGSLAEEAARLLEALSGLARGHTDQPSADDGDAPGIADRGGERSCVCGWCPLCRGVDVLRAASPEVRTHLVAAGASLLHAAAGLLAAASGPPGASPGAARRRGPGVERIDVDDEGLWPDQPEEPQEPEEPEEEERR